MRKSKMGHGIIARRIEGGRDMKTKRVDHMNLNEARSAMLELRARLDRGEITVDEFKAMRVPIGNRIRQLF
jgi:uncharacterized membrane protein